MDMAKVWGVIRHVVGGVGAALVGFGLADAETISQLPAQVEAVAGAVAFIGALIASVVAKIKGE